MKQSYFKENEQYLDLYRNKIKILSVKPLEDEDYYISYEPVNFQEPDGFPCAFHEKSLFGEKLKKINTNPKRKEFVSFWSGGCPYICDSLEYDKETNDLTLYAYIFKDDYKLFNEDKLSSQDKEKLLDMIAKTQKNSEHLRDNYLK